MQSHLITNLIFPYGRLFGTNNMLYASIHRKIVEDVPRGVHMNFLKAERSLHRWALEDLRRIHAAEELAAEEGGGVEMHVLEDAGHWVYYLIRLYF